MKMATVALIFASVLMLALQIFVVHKNLNYLASMMRAEYTDSQKQLVKQEVMSVVDMIGYQIKTSRKQAAERVRQRVYEACAIAENIYRKNKDKKSLPEIKKMVKDALRPMRFLRGNGYYFATNLDGIEELFPDKPEFEGKNMLAVRDVDGKYVVKDMIEIVKKQQEGVYSYHWSKPHQEGKKFLKIAYVKEFKPFNWLIGTGVYVDDLRYETQKYIIGEISKIRFENGGYVFVNTFDGYILSSNGRVIENGKKLWSAFGEKAKTVFEKEKIAALKKDGGFIYYSWPKIDNSKKEYPKISFVYGIKEWNWIVGAGVYTDEIENMTTLIKQNLYRKMFYRVIMVISISFLLILFSIFLYYGLYKKLKNDFNVFTSFFQDAALKDKKINLREIELKELRIMALNANKMLDKKAEIDNIYEDEFIQSFVNIMEARDVYTKGHSQRVAYYAKKIAKTLGLDTKKQEYIYKAGLLHDIGKIGIPDNILLKPGKLSENEYRIMKYHPVFSYEILKELEHFKSFANCVRGHHEKCDGSGYPDGLKCGEITIGAKILAIADIFDALTTTRPYRHAFSPSKAMEILKQESVDKEILQKVESVLIESYTQEDFTEVRFMSYDVDIMRNEIFKVDYMTGLELRSVFLKEIQKLIDEKRRFVFIRINIKQISRINYMFSEQAGDAVIISMAQVLLNLSKEEPDICKKQLVSRAYADIFFIAHELKKERNINKETEMMKRSKKKLKDEFKNAFSNSEFYTMKDKDGKSVVDYVDFDINYAIYPDDAETVEELVYKVNTKRGCNSED